jgi:thiol-disulfide isomerase/thioredoxin
MKNLFLVTSLLIAMVFIPNQGYSQENTQPELMVVKFHADWCGSCRALGPVLTDLTNKLDGKPVLFVKLDFTNNTSKHQTKLLAFSLGIEKIVAQNNSTGFLLVVDSKTKEVKAKLTKEKSVKEMANEINSLL